MSSNYTAFINSEVIARESSSLYSGLSKISFSLSLHKNYEPHFMRLIIFGKKDLNQSDGNRRGLRLLSTAGGGRREVKFGVPERSVDLLGKRRSSKTVEFFALAWKRMKWSLLRRGAAVEKAEEQCRQAPEGFFGNRKRGCEATSNPSFSAIWKHHCNLNPLVWTAMVFSL